MNVSVLLGGIGLSFYALSILTCLFMIILIFISSRPLKSNVSMILMGNTYLALFLFATCMLVMYTYNLYGNLRPSSWLGGHWCDVRTYLSYVFLSAIYYSFVLQALFRLVRIVFYRHKSLQSFRIILISLVMQWVLSFLIILPNVFLGDLQYLPYEFNCWIPFENIRGLLMLIIFIYGTSTSIISSIYMYIMRYIHRTNNIPQRNENINQREFTILKRLVTLVTVVAGLGLPAIVVILLYICTNTVIAYAYHIQGVSLSGGTFIASISLAFITPQIMEKLKRQQGRVQAMDTLSLSVNKPYLVPVGKWT